MTKEQILISKTKSIYLLEENMSIPADMQFLKNSDSLSVVDQKEFNNHFKKYDFFHSDHSPKKMGQFFLYEKLLNGRYKSNIPHDHELFYPKLGLYLNALPCDQTIEIEWVNYRRTWEIRTEYDYEYKGKIYQNYIGELPTEIERLPLWGDNLLVYGVWDSMPNWKQLRQAYERTWWFHRDKDELRDIQLDRLLK